jgi:hypothetical protein
MTTDVIGSAAVVSLVGADLAEGTPECTNQELGPRLGVGDLVGLERLQERGPPELLVG